MAKQTAPLLALNRGLIDTEALARVDLDRTRLSAEVMTNWLPKTQGAMRIRPGTKYIGNGLNDTGAEFIEFVASTDDVALLELTTNKMRVWLGSDAHNLSLLGRPLVDTTVSVTDTGWSRDSLGGSLSQSAGTDQIPTMTAATTGGVTMSAGSENTASTAAWKAGDNDNSTNWETQENDTGNWWIQVDFGAGNPKAIETHTVRADDGAQNLAKSPKQWRLMGSNDAATWTIESDTGVIGSQTGWAASERRSFTDTGYTDTGANAWRYWRIQIKTTDDPDFPEESAIISEIELKTAAATSNTQVQFDASGITLNAEAIGSLARARRQIVVDTGVQGVEHSLAITIDRGPVTFRAGSTAGDDDYISNTQLGTGCHNLAFTPSTNIHLTVQSDAIVNRVIGSIAIGDSGTVEIPTDWGQAALDLIRYDQSADVVYVAASGVSTRKIERRGTGRSWSVVKYEPTDGPFLSTASTEAKLDASDKYGNTTLTSDIPFFNSTHTGSLIRMFHDGQSGTWPLGNLDAVTDAVKVVGIGDTGRNEAESERRIQWILAGSFTGTFELQRSFDGPDSGFKQAPDDFGTTSATTTGTRNVDDTSDNVDVWYRVKCTAYTSGVALATINVSSGGTTGIVRINAVNTSTNADAEVVKRLSDTGPTEIWEEGVFSDEKGWPTAVSLHGGRLFLAKSANLYGSVSDDFESFDEDLEGDAGPINRTLGSGPVNNIFYLVSLLRLIIGTSGSEIELRSSSIDEPVTPSNNSAQTFSTRGSANLRPLRMDTSALFVQRSNQRIYLVAAGQGPDAFSDFGSRELTILVPTLLKEGVVSIAIQRQPDTRIHCVLADGRVAILTYEQAEEVLAWSLWETDGSVERAAVLPGSKEDAVYYYVNRTVGGSTVRFLEKWALETESIGDTGLSWLADAAWSYTDTGRTTDIQGGDHLIGKSVVVWADDTGQTDAGKDLSPDVDGVQTTYTVDTGGNVTTTEAVHHAVAGLPFTATWKSSKLTYGAEFGSALTQYKRPNKVGFVAANLHNNGLFFGTDTGVLDALPRKSDEAAVVDADKIYKTYDKTAVPMPGVWDEDPRLVLRGKSPRPVTILAAIPSVDTKEKI